MGIWETPALNIDAEVAGDPDLQSATKTEVEIADTLPAGRYKILEAP